MIRPAGRGARRLFPSEQPFHFEAMRALGFAPFKGAEPAEVLETISHVTEGDEESWYEAWARTASRLDAGAARSIYDHVGRGCALLRAANYYRTAEFFLPPGDARKDAMYRKSIDRFYAGLDALRVRYERFDAPYGDSSIPALYFPAATETSETPLLVIVNGYDSIKEEIYFVVVEAALERGYSILTYDGPGQGAALRERGLRFTPAWEAVNRAVLDAHFACRPLRPVVIVGYSLGSILATRAAADDARIHGLVQHDIFYDFAEAVSFAMPSLVRAAIFEGGSDSALLRVGTGIATRLSVHKRFALNHGRWVFGIDDPVAVLREYARYTTRDVLPLVRADVLLLAGKGDHIVPLPLLDKTRAELTSARSVSVEVFDAESGGEEHCQVGAMTVWQHRLFEWLGEASYRPWQRPAEARG